MSTHRPEITVCMPAYNAAAHLREALDFILTQTFEDFELLLVDDGSTDTTLALATAVAEADRRVRIERLPVNRGRATARNMALGVRAGATLPGWTRTTLPCPKGWNCSTPALKRSPTSTFAVRAWNTLGIRRRWSFSSAAGRGARSSTLWCARAQRVFPAAAGRGAQL